MGQRRHVDAETASVGDEFRESKRLEFQTRSKGGLVRDLNACCGAVPGRGRVFCDFQHLRAVETFCQNTENDST